MSSHADRPAEPTPQPHAPLALSVWPTAQHTSRAQRTGRYLPASNAHPARMLPAIARHAISTYTRPGELIVDPMCGIGTTCVEAVHLGRDAIGVDLEARWTDLAAANLAHAAAQGATGQGQVLTGDARHLPSLLAERLDRPAALVLTSPPYGPHVHGQLEARPGAGVAKWDDSYQASSRANLARAADHALPDAVGEILAACRQVLRPDGVVVMTTRPWRRADRLVDFPAAVTRAAEQAGLVLVDRCVALLAGVRGDRLVPRQSFFALKNVRDARARGLPLHVIAHEDVLVLQPIETATRSPLPRSVARQ